MGFEPTIIELQSIALSQTWLPVHRWTVLRKHRHTSGVSQTKESCEIKKLDIGGLNPQPYYLLIKLLLVLLALIYHKRLLFNH